MVKLKGALIGYTFAMVAYCVEILTKSCSPMFRHIWDTIIGVSADKEWKYSSTKVKVMEISASHLQYKAHLSCKF